MRGGRPTPIVWQDQHNRGQGKYTIFVLAFFSSKCFNENPNFFVGGGPRNMNQQLNMSPTSRAQYPQNQRAQRGRRMRRPSGPNFGNNMRY